MNSNKIIGYILVLAGILLILWPLFQTYQIFTGKALPPQIFMKPIQGKTTSSNTIEGQIQNAVVGALPLDSLYNTLNLSNWVILLWILMYGGGKLADIGVKLAKS